MSKRKSKGDGSVFYDPKRNRWFAQVQIGLQPNGRPRYRRASFRTETEAEQFRRKLVAELLTGTYREPVKLTIEEWVRQWISEYKPNIKHSTRVRYLNDIDSHIIPRLGQKKLDALKSQDVQMWVNELQRLGLKPKTIKNVHGVLHAALKKAVQLDLIARNPSDVGIVELPRIEKADVSPLEQAQQRKFLRSLGSDVYASVYRFALLTGMRQAEILGLTWDCINFERGEIHIEKQLLFPKMPGEGYVLGSPKGNRPRTITPARQVMELLRERRRVQAQDRLRNGAVWDDCGMPNLVFTSENGKYLHYRTVDRHFYQALERAGVEHHRFHDLRHTFAVNCVYAGIDVKTLSDSLGHYDAAFTLNRYGHFTNDMRMRASAQQADFIAAVLGL